MNQMRYKQNEIYDLLDVATFGSEGAAQTVLD
jgi:hypothetical protein